MILGAQRLRFESLASLLEEHRNWAVAALCLLWVVPGLLGRDIWKPEEAHIFGTVYSMLISGDWLVPGLAGETFLRHPPFYHWTASLAGRLLSPPLALPDAVRLVNVAYLGGTLWFTGMTVSRLQGSGRGWLGPLVLLGCVGLVQPSHQLVPENALLLAHALTAYGLAATAAATAPAALCVGCGIGIAFLSRGISSAFPLVAVIALVPLMLPAFRSRGFMRFVILAAVVSLPWLLLWPLTLALHDAALFQEWWLQQVGRLRIDVADAQGSGSSVLYFLSVLPWFAWPVLPFAAYGVWLSRSEMRTSVRVTLPLLVFLCTLAVLSLVREKREIFALPLLVPLSILASSAVPNLRRGAINAFFWFGIAFFLFLLAAAWFYFVAVEFGIPGKVARHMAAMEPGYVPSVPVWAMVLAGTLTIAWLVSLFNIRRAPERPFVTWAAGATAFWAVLMALMLGWIDNAKSYRGMIAELARVLPPQRGCVSSFSLGESQRALLHYHAGLTTRRVEAGWTADQCDFLLVAGKRGDNLWGQPWQFIWEGHRAGDDRERFRLYRQDKAITVKTPRPSPG
ncbi:MAG: glycosyltransferase family 39 protein [Betaproteobacteria bacterium]